MLGALLGFAVERGMLASNVAAGIRHLHSVNRADLVWEERHWQAVAGVPAHIRDALALARLTGLRLSDLVALDWAHVGANAIVLVTAKRKGRAVVPLTPELRAHLDARPHREGAVLQTTQGNRWTADGFKTVWQRKRPAGFDRTVHDLRGTFATFAMTRGLTDQEIAMVLGWTAKRVGSIRARYVDEERVILSLAKRLSG